MTIKEKREKLISLKMEISKIRAAQAKQKKKKNIDLAISLATGIASIGTLNLYLHNPNEIANLITTGALITSSLISLDNYSNYNYIMNYYDQEVDDLKEEISRTL